jgi:hypothetical protein
MLANGLATPALPCRIATDGKPAGQTEAGGMGQRFLERNPSKKPNPSVNLLKLKR